MGTLPLPWSYSLFGSESRHLALNPLSHTADRRVRTWVRFVRGKRRENGIGGARG